MQPLEPRLLLAVVDTIAPAVHAITPPDAGTYGEGRALVFRAHFTEPVLVTGMPTLPIMIGDSVREATWNGRGSGRKSLVFTTVVQPGDAAPSGLTIAGPIRVPAGAAIRDRAANDLAGDASGTFAGVHVDAVGPSVTAFGPATISGKFVSLQMVFNEPVLVRGRPSIPFTLAGAARRLAYAGGSGGDRLTFRYKATRGEALTPDTIVMPTHAVDMHTWSVTDRARNAATSMVQPTDIDVSATSVPENEPGGTVVATLVAVDADGGRDHHTYELVAGADSTDNSRFQIVGNQLQTVGTFDFETTTRYAVRIRATDSGGLSAEKAVAISVTDVNDVVVPFVTVADVGNVGDTGLGYGAVGYQYRIGTYEVTNSQYATFLNAVATTDTYALYNVNMGIDARGGIMQRTGPSGGFTYSVKDNMGDKPVNYVSWFDAARFANWMHNGQPTGPQGAATTEAGAYTLNGMTMGTAPARNTGARVSMPTENEWYKSAYFKGGSVNAGYWNYATQSDAIPTAGTAGPTGIGASGGTGNVVNYNFAAQWNSQYGNVTTVGTNGGPGYYGTFDQSGNVWEWNDLDGAMGPSRGLQGGSWELVNPFDVSRTNRLVRVPSIELAVIGFRLASPV